MNSSIADFSELALQIKQWGIQLGFDEIGITDTKLEEHETHLMNWLAADHHGTMEYMNKHGNKRSQPEKLIPGTIRIISTRINYQAPNATNEEEVLNDSSQAYISRYALGRDYHKVIRKRLQQLAEYIESKVGSFGYRAFVDSAPVLEKALAEKAGLGWIGKHTNLINRECGSWFFIGELKRLRKKYLNNIDRTRSMYNFGSVMSVISNNVAIARNIGNFLHNVNIMFKCF